MLITELIFDAQYKMNDFKAHLATGRLNKKEPLMALVKNEFKNWQEYQNNKNFERKYILSLIYYSKDEWIFGGVYENISVKKAYNKIKNKDYYQYETKLLDIHKDLIGRLIINFKKDFRQSYVRLEKHHELFIVSQILKIPYKVDKFPGFENVLIDFEYLQEIINEIEPTWFSSLSNIKGIYLITDFKNGKQYVGSAYGQNAFWDRWANYAKNGHGDNKDLKSIIDQNGIQYAYNFKFSVLEIRSSITDDQIIIDRESHWKNMLGTREYGYNKN